MNQIVLNYCHDVYWRQPYSLYLVNMSIFCSFDKPVFVRSKIWDDFVRQSKARFTQVKFFNGYPSNYICKFACVASLACTIVLKLKNAV